MDKIGHIGVWPRAPKIADDFILSLNAKIDNLNSLITQFNQANEPEKTEILFEIDQYRKHIIGEYPGDLIGNCPDFNQYFENQLFNQLKAEFDKRAISLYPAAPGTTDDFSKFIAKMSPEKIAKLVEILSMYRGENLKKQLTTLYTEDNIEAHEFNALLKKYKIEPSGGINCKIFQIKIMVGSKVLSILKVDDRQDNPRNLEAKLYSNALSNVLSKKHVERTTTYRGHQVGLSIIDYEPHGNLIVYGAQQKTPSEKCSSAIHIFKQMAGILSIMQRENVAFPDMKATNWLIGEGETVKIADAKSFVPTTSNGDINKEDANFKWYGKEIINSSDVNPPDVERPNTIINAEKLHAYILGKNLYQYLTGCSDAYLAYMKGEKIFSSQQRHQFDESDFLESTHDSPHFNRDTSAFAGPIGQELKQIILSLVQPKPEDITLTIDQVFEKLAQLEMKSAADVATSSFKARLDQLKKAGNVPEEPVVVEAEKSGLGTNNSS